MSGRIVRTSKFRHVYGQQYKKQDCYDDIRITKSSWDSTFCSVNPHFLAIVTESAGGGAFLVLPLDKIGRVPVDYPLVAGHKAAVLDISWCPHNDHIIASASEDCTVKIWQIPEGGLRENLTECAVDLVGHQRRVGLIAWHPSASNVLLSAGADYRVFIWDLTREEILIAIDCHPDVIMSAAWNYDGSLFLTTCKDKFIRIIDPRNGTVLQQFKGHGGTKPMRGIFLKDGRIFTTGFSRMSNRQYAVWDPKVSEEHIIIEDMDTSNGVLFPFYDPDTGLIFLCGKGDSAIRYFEYISDPVSVYYVNTFLSADPQRGMGMMPKRGLDVSHCEIARFYKLLNTGLCEIIAFTVPRKSELFQEDLYPDTFAEEPAITVDEWWQGKNANPVMMPITADQLSNIASKKISSLSNAPKHNDVSKKQNSNHVDPKKGPSDQSTSDSAELISIEKLMDEIRKLKAVIKNHERRIKVLEEKCS